MMRLNKTQVFSIFLKKTIRFDSYMIFSLFLLKTHLKKMFFLCVISVTSVTFFAIVALLLFP